MAIVLNNSKMKVDIRGAGGVLSKALTRLKKRRIFKKKNYPITVVFVSGEESRKLNKAHRQKNKPTNVLSFDYEASGELILCPEVIRKEAKKAGNSVKKQTALMIVHGLVHLSGLHHDQSGKKAEKAEKLEESVLASLGFK